MEPGMSRREWLILKSQIPWTAEEISFLKKRWGDDRLCADPKFPSELLLLGTFMITTETIRLLMRRKNINVYCEVAETEFPFVPASGLIETLKPAVEVPRIDHFSSEDLDAVIKRTNCDVGLDLYDYCAPEKSAIPKTTLQFHRLKEDATSATVIKEVSWFGGEEQNISSIAHLFKLIEQQANGEDGPLLVNGDRNVSFVRPSTYARCTAVRYLFDGGRWRIRAYLIWKDDIMWDPGTQFITRRSYKIRD